MKRLHALPLIVSVPLLLIGCGGSGGGSTSTTPTGAGNFVQANLVGDTNASKPTVVDPNLVNPWGISAAPGGAFWVSDNATGLSTLYNTTGAIQPLVVKIPSASGPTGGPVTGQVYNATGQFALPGGAVPSFIFVSVDGLITGWNSGASAVVAVNNSAAGSAYTGVTLGNYAGANYLYAANFSGNKVEVYDQNYNLVNSFTDTSLPTGYAPFGISTIGGNIYVTFALQNATKNGSVAGAGNGYVDVFSPTGSLVQHLASQGALNAPWGVVQAPTGFGKLAGDVLVGNFGDGKINAYSSNGTYVGALNTATGTPLVIPGLWGLIFGSGGQGGSLGTLYFTSGPNGENNGLLGSLTPSS